MEEILKIVPFLRAKTLVLHKPDNLDFLRRSIAAAELNLQYKELSFRYVCYPYAFLPRRPVEPFGHIEQLDLDWHSLEGFAAPCLEENFEEIYNDLIKVG